MLKAQEVSVNRMSDDLNPPYGGELVNLIAGPRRALEIQTESREWPSWDLTPRQLCDLELLLNGGFSPLRGFMSRADYESTCSRMRLADGKMWPIPVVLDVSDEFARAIGPGSSIALRDPEGVMLAVLHVEEVWQPDRDVEAEAVYGTTSSSHHATTNTLLEQTYPWYVGGRIEGSRLPAHYDFRSLRLTPSELRAEFIQHGWKRIVGFHCGLMHRAHHELTLEIMKQTEANLLIHPAIGTVNPDDAEHYVRVRCYQGLLARYPRDAVKLALLPLRTHTLGPREAVLHAIVRKNYGCSHFIVSPDVIGSVEDQNRERFWGPYAAQELFGALQKEIGINMVPLEMMPHLKGNEASVPEGEATNGSRALNISGVDLRRHLLEGGEIPSWFTFPEVAKELQRSYPSRHRQGFTVLFTGLSGSGKSTIANALLVKLLEKGDRRVTLLDGDIVRKNLSSELGFSREHRDINIRRIGFVASEITKHGGIAICAPIAPYDVVRKQVRAMIEPYGGFILVYLSTPLEVCESRDRKGLYEKARAGVIQQFTGISDPYEVPNDADLVMDTGELMPENVTQQILLHMERKGFIEANGDGG